MVQFWHEAAVLCFVSLRAWELAFGAMLASVKYLKSEARKFTPYHVLFLVLIFHFRMKKKLANISRYKLTLKNYVKYHAQVYFTLYWLSMAMIPCSFHTTRISPYYQPEDFNKLSVLFRSLSSPA